MSGYQKIFEFVAIFSELANLQIQPNAASHDQNTIEQLGRCIYLNKLDKFYLF